MPYIFNCYKLIICAVKAKLQVFEEPKNAPKVSRMESLSKGPLIHEEKTMYVSLTQTYNYPWLVVV